MKKWVLISFLFFLFFDARSQEEATTERIVVYATMLDGDTIPVIPLKKSAFIRSGPYKSKREARKMTKLIRNVKVVYPYAKLAGIKLMEYEEILAGLMIKKKEKR